ncbi:MAG: EVE domain-containing protein, partial [Pseudomonadota bacterium]
MQVGDLGFFYHSVHEKRVMGVVEVIAPSAPDPTTDDDRWDCVTVKALGAFPEPVTLEQAKADPRLAEMVLVNNTRLSVQPVTEAEWTAICDLGGYDGPGA